jgi:hypothetical protein
MTTEEPPMTKQQVWKQAHAQRTECPDCHRFVTLRTLRWRHVCGRRSLQQRLLVEADHRVECGAGLIVLLDAVQIARHQFADR